jgi:hypothetical protein
MPTVSYVLGSISPEFVVNATTANDQSVPDVVMLPNGDLFLTFDSEDATSPAHHDAMFRRFSAAGTALDAFDQIISNGNGADDEEHTSIAILSNGNVVVVNEDNNAGADDDVEFHLFTNTGALVLGHNFITQAESFATDNQFRPQVAALTGGGFAVVYYDEFASDTSNTNAEMVIFENDGSLRAGPIIAGGSTSALQVLDATVTALTNGNFVVAWRQDIGGGDFNVRFRIFNSSGATVGSEVTVNTDLDDQSQPVMAALPGGGFALVLRDEVNGSATNTELELYIYNASGTAVGGSTWNPGAGDLMSQPDIALISDNLLLVSYTSDRNAHSDIFGQLFTLDGVFAGAELNLVVGAGTQSSSALAANGVVGGRFAMGWSDSAPHVDDTAGFHASGVVRQVLRLTSGDGTSETLVGDDLRDSIRGNGGNDVIDGGAASDTSTYAGNVGSYRFDFLGADNLRIADLRAASPDGTDTLHSIEALGFVADSLTLSIVLGTPGDDNIVAGTNRAISAGTGNDTLTLDFALTGATFRFAGNSVVIESGSNHVVANGFETFIFTDGTVQNSDGSPLIDDLFYYAENHDVWLAHVDADAHYNASGWHEGRDPSAFFSTHFYLLLNPDVAAAGINPLAHFDAAGWLEGRIGSINFNGAQYRAHNPDVAAANIDPLAHFLASGAQEGRVPFGVRELFAANGFDYAHYLRNNPDVAAAGVDPLWHFQTVGWQEGRDPNWLFDVGGYLAAYPDVAAAQINPFDHYNQSGWHEGRDPSVDFDTLSYLAANPDVAAAGVNPLVHYLVAGIHEGRSAFPDGVFA